MPLHCAAYGCKSRQGCCETKISFHRFPLKNPLLLKIWLSKIRRKDWQPTIYSRLCGRHFTSDDYIYSGGRTWLKKDVAPSVFSFSSNFSKTSNKDQNLIQKVFKASTDDLHPKYKEVTSNTADLLNKDLLFSKTLETTNTMVKKASPVLSEEHPYSLEKFDHNYCSYPKITQDSMNDQTEKQAVELATTPLNENQTLNLDKIVQFSFSKLCKRLKSIKKPSKRWELTKHIMFIMCTKWNEAFIAERKIIVDRKLNVRVFLYNSEVTNPELKRLQCTEDLSKLLITVDGYHILTENEGLSLTHPTLSTISKMTS